MTRPRRVTITLAALPLFAAAGCTNAPAASPTATLASSATSPPPSTTTSTPAPTGTDRSGATDTSGTSGASMSPTTDGTPTPFGGLTGTESAGATGEPGATGTLGAANPTETAGSPGVAATSPEGWTAAAQRLLVEDRALAGAQPVFGVSGTRGPDHATIDLPPGDLVAYLLCTGSGGLQARAAEKGVRVLAVGTESCAGTPTRYSGRLPFPRGAKNLTLSVTGSRDDHSTVVFFHAPAAAPTPS